MEISEGSGSDTKPQNHQLEKKRVNRAPSPARPFIKDVHSRSAKAPAAGPRSPKVSKQQQQSAPPPSAHPNRNSRRSTAGPPKDKLAAVKSLAKSPAVRKPLAKVPHPGAAEPRAAGTKPDGTGSPLLAKGKKGRTAPGPLGHGSPIRVPTGVPLGRVSQTDSSSDLSDCPSEPLSDEQRLAQAASSDPESGTGSSDRDQPGAEAPQRAEASGAAADDAPARAGSACQARAAPGPLAGRRKQEKASTSAPSRGAGAKQRGDEDLLREVEELRSENDYLKVRW